MVAGDLAEDTTRAIISEVHRRFLPNKVLLARPGGELEAQKAIQLSPFLEDLKPFEEPAKHFFFAANTPASRL